MLVNFTGALALPPTCSRVFSFARLGTDLPQVWTYALLNVLAVLVLCGPATSAS